MQFQKRDAAILTVIYENDGVLAKRQLKKLFWPGRSWRAMERRLAKLHCSSYVVWPSRGQHKIHPIPEPICWLGWRGALFIAGSFGRKVKPPLKDNEYQLRTFQKRLRDQGIRWAREPRWSLLAHDLAVVDLRLAVESAVGQIPALTLKKWLPDSEFRSNMDVVQFTAKNRDGRSVRMKRGVCPDAYFEIVDENLRVKGEPHRARFLLEMDMATHCNPSFGRYKALPGVAYIKSEAYKNRFGNNHGVWLVVTSGGERRIGNLMRQTEERVGEQARLFFFTSRSELEGANVLTSPVWHHGDAKQRRPLIG